MSARAGAAAFRHSGRPGEPPVGPDVQGEEHSGRGDRLMYRLLFVAMLALVGGCREETHLDDYLGPYYGGFDTALTPDPGDDLNPNECAAGDCGATHGDPLSHLLMKLALDPQGRLTLTFYRTEDDYEAGRPIYLSRACRTTLGPSDDYRLHPVDEHRDETQVVATARFPLVFGNPILSCTDSARFSSGADPHMDLSLQANPVTGARAATVRLERSRRDGNYLYVKRKGEAVPVRLDLRYAGRDRLEARRLCAADDETLLENADGHEAVCVLTGRDTWQVVLPVSPYGPGVTAFWGSTRSPKWYRTSDEPDVVTYHTGVFLPVRFDPESP